MTVNSLCREMTNALLHLYGKREAGAIVKEIWRWLKGWDATELIIRGDDEVSPLIEGEARKAMKRLMAWEPVQYITGSAPFFGLDIHVKPGVLIPRPETAELVQAIVDEWGKTPDLRVADACTGSGAIAVALARNLPFSKITAIDVSEESIEVACENVKKFKVDVDVQKGDILNMESLPGQFDILVSNPPYIEESEKKEMLPNVVDYEPEEALFVADSNPLIFYKALAGLGRKCLRKGGMAYFEINPLHASEMQSLLENEGYEEVDVWRDSEGKLRFIKGRLQQ